MGQNAEEHKYRQIALKHKVHPIVEDYIRETMEEYM